MASTHSNYNVTGNYSTGSSTTSTIPSLASRRWVPPNLRNQLTPNEITFRHIRGILNKLTPDNFDKLSNQLAQYIAGSNREVLSGAILLIFEKAIDEAKYSFMYGRLCLKLNDLATNFEDPNSKTTTFRRLLLSKCKGEFENRTKIVSTNEQDDLSSERSEYRDVFRRKMLGNVKFIGELFKLGMLHEAVVHQCIKQLLEKRRSLPELCDNIECVCNLLYTVGYLLDTDKAKSWMDKYFERMEVLSRTNDFPPRIRFMIMNTTELRRDQWRPRHRKYNEVPKPLERSPVSYRPHPHLITKPLPPKVDEEKTNLQAQSVTPPIKSIKLPSAKKTDSTNVSLRPSIPPAKFQQQKFNTSDVKSQTTPPPDDGGRRHTIPRTRDDSSDEDEVAPPFLKSHSNQLAPHHLPPAHPVVPYYRGLIRPPNPHPGHPYPPPHMFAPPHSLTYPSLARYMGPPMSWPHPSLYSFPPQQPTNEMVVKNKSETSPITKKSNRKGMVSNKVIEQSEEERKIVPMVTKYLSTHDIKGMTSLLTETGISPVTMTTILINATITSSEDDRCMVSLLLEELFKQDYITSNDFIKTIKDVLVGVSKADGSCIVTRNALAGFIARFISKGVTSLLESLELFKGGAHHPLGVVTLQALLNLIGQEELVELMKKNKLIITQLLPAGDRSYLAAAKVLEKRNLGFLYPMKQIHSDINSFLNQSDSNALLLYKWIKSNVEMSFQSHSEFIIVLTKCILNHVTKGSYENPSKEIIAEQTKLLMEYKVVIQKFVIDDPNLQMSVLYATQIHCYDLGFPKGLLLRLFSLWYDSDVVEEEVLMKWREDPSDEYPGKGRALFQVNQWLVLLADAEEESD